jgi:MHS family proline/betaine transporter-like MFS transporter
MASSTNEAVQPATTYAEATEAEKHAVLRKVTGSSFLGNFIEWFDYASYSYLATVIAMVFFPAEDRAVAVMSTFGVFALSFLVRPIGAIFWGNMGDKKGRKWALATSILMMSAATFVIGLLARLCCHRRGSPASASAAAHGAVVLGGGRICWRCHLYRGVRAA